LLSVTELGHSSCTKVATGLVYYYVLVDRLSYHYILQPFFIPRAHVQPG